MSENKNENYMDGIIAVNDVLNWFENPPETGIDYRAIIEEKNWFSDDFFSSNIAFYTENKKKKDAYYKQGGWGEFPNDFDCDSSPRAWEHYIRHYASIIFGATEDEYEGKKQNYSFEGLKYSGKRIVSVPEVCAKNLKSRMAKIKENRISFEPERLGGDCDFNFNEEKCTIFRKYLGGNEGRNNLLEECSRMHHTLLNFSLMQGSGNLQAIKQNCDNDRLDRFLYILNGFFVRDEECTLKIKRRKTNRENRLHYLSQFSKIDKEEIPKDKCIYNYCAKIYFLPTENYHTGMMIQKNVNVNNPEYKNRWDNLLASNSKLINALIESGKKPLDSSDRVVEYMRLAVHFWKAKEDYFRLMDDIMEDEKKKQ